MRKIVLIENDPDLRFILERCLIRAGYEVVCFGDASPVLDCSIPAPDLFIIDKDLPAIDGVALCKFLNLQRSYCEKPVLLISSHSIEQKALRAGASAFLQKPFDFTALLKTIEQLTTALELVMPTDLIVHMRVLR